MNHRTVARPFVVFECPTVLEAGRLDRDVEAMLRQSPSFSAGLEKMSNGGDVEVRVKGSFLG